MRNINDRQVRDKYTLEFKLEAVPVMAKILGVQRVARGIFELNYSLNLS